MRKLIAILIVSLSPGVLAQGYDLEWEAAEEELLRHFRALLQFDTSDPPGRE